MSALTVENASEFDRSFGHHGSFLRLLCSSVPLSFMAQAHHSLRRPTHPVNGLQTQDYAPTRSDSQSMRGRSTTTRARVLQRSRVQYSRILSLPFGWEGSRPLPVSGITAAGCFRCLIHVTFRPACRLIHPGGCYDLVLARPSPCFPVSSSQSRFHLRRRPHPRSRYRCQYRHLPAHRLPPLAHYSGQEPPGVGNHPDCRPPLGFRPVFQPVLPAHEGFAEIAVWSDERFNLATGGEVRKAKGIRVSGDFFHVLGVEPILGRLLGPEDDQPGCSLSGANISYAFWQRNFAGDPSVIGNGSPWMAIPSK